MLGTLNNIKINIFSNPVVIKWTVSVRNNGIAGQFKTGILPLPIWVCYVKVLVSKIITSCESDLTVNYGNFSVITIIHEHVKCKLDWIEYTAVNAICTHFLDEILVKEEDTSYIIIE